MLPLRTCGLNSSLPEGGNRYLLGKGVPSKQRAGDVVFDRIGYGTADQVHLADELDALFCRVIEFKYEAKDVACIDEGK